jgi:hypothetical protein
VCYQHSTHSDWQHKAHAGVSTHACTAHCTLLLLWVRSHTWCLCPCCSLSVPLQAFAVDGTPADSVMLALNSPVFKVSSTSTRPCAVVHVLSVLCMRSTCVSVHAAAAPAPTGLTHAPASTSSSAQRRKPCPYAPFVVRTSVGWLAGLLPAGPAL